MTICACCSPAWARTVLNAARVIERQTTDQVADKGLGGGEDRRAFVLAPVVRGRKGEVHQTV